ncbi:putative nuclease HARBI1 [Benincasa hispida]|uniref:putative nuclease HARBI1 n=1 Tax=Benincasa hispida TaxID=102211 RepID=UPI0019025582|nr:putative nuclease HARBI1 [Benincasa hispida]
MEDESDFRYPNAEGFLALYRGKQYHLFDWRGAGNAPTTGREFFNMKHSSARNVIERAFGLLKGRWAILRAKLFYPIQVQCRIITACCLIHNLITREMGIDAMLDVPDEENSTSVGLDGDHIEFVESSNEWTKFRDDLAVEMFIQW